MHSHSCNNQGSFRWFLHWGNGKKHSCFTFEWSWYKSFRFGLNVGEDWTLAICPGLFSIYLSLDIPILRWFERKFLDYEGRDLSISIHHWTLWLNFWTSDMSSSYGRKWWDLVTLLKKPSHRHWTFHRDSFFLGDYSYKEKALWTAHDSIKMPEGSYMVRMRFFRSTWKRKRFPYTKTVDRCELTPQYPIGVPGKGTTSYNCDEDATYSMTTPAKNQVDAISSLRESIMRSRKKYGSGESWRPSRRWEKQW